MLPYIAEFLGTMLLILLGDGVVANVTLNKSGMKGAGSVQITFAWGLAVMIPACIFGAASGASFNPALTLALAIDGSFAWSMVPGYIIAQFAGAFVGACLVYLLFKGQFDATDDAAAKRGVFCTAPSRYHCFHRYVPGRSDRIRYQPGAGSGAETGPCGAAHSRKGKLRLGLRHCAAGGADSRCDCGGGVVCGNSVVNGK